MYGRDEKKKSLTLIVLSLLVLSGCVVLFLCFGSTPVAADLLPNTNNPYRVLAPIQSGDLTIFPVVLVSGGKPPSWQYITLDEGLSSGEVIITEAGRARGLVRDRGLRRTPHGLDDGLWRQAPPFEDHGMGDAVNRLVLINNSKKPLILLAGEIVTGGRQDRVIGKDRIVPPGSEPIDLSVFCIEHGRWTSTSAFFGMAGKQPTKSFMVQPRVRGAAMAEQNQQQVWSAVHGAVSSMVAAAPSASSSLEEGSAQSTTSYAKAMQLDSVGKKVDEAGEKLLHAREEILSKIRQEHAVGVVAAVKGEVVWADIFTDTDMLAKYWTKLIRSYAAEALTSETRPNHPATVTEAQSLLDMASSGQETSEGEVGVYRYSEMRSGIVAAFVLRALLPGTDFDVHLSKMKMERSPELMPLPRRHQFNLPVPPR